MYKKYFVFSSLYQFISKINRFQQTKIYFGTCEKFINIAINFFMTSLNPRGINVVDFIDG